MGLKWKEVSVNIGGVKFDGDITIGTGPKKKLTVKDLMKVKEHWDAVGLKTVPMEPAKYRFKMRRMGNVHLVDEYGNKIIFPDQEGIFKKIKRGTIFIPSLAGFNQIG